MRSAGEIVSHEGSSQALDHSYTLEKAMNLSLAT